MARGDLLGRTTRQQLLDAHRLTGIHSRVIVQLFLPDLQTPVNSGLRLHGKILVGRNLSGMGRGLARCVDREKLYTFRISLIHKRNRNGHP